MKYYYLLFFSVQSWIFESLFIIPKVVQRPPKMTENDWNCHF